MPLRCLHAGLWLLFAQTMSARGGSLIRLARIDDLLKKGGKKGV
jgi:hypothetical protein